MLRIRKGIKQATVFVAPYGEIKVEDANADFLNRMGFKHLVEDDNIDREGKIKPIAGYSQREDVPGHAGDLVVRVPEGAKNTAGNKPKTGRPKRKPGSV